MTEIITLTIKDWEKIKEVSWQLDEIASNASYKETANRLWKIINKYDFAYKNRKPKIKVYTHEKIQEYLSELDEVAQQHQGTYRKHFKEWLN